MNEEAPGARRLQLCPMPFSGLWDPQGASEISCFLMVCQITWIFIENLKNLGVMPPKFH